MSRFPSLSSSDAQDANAEVAALYDEIIAAGFGATEPINWFSSQSSRPDLLRATWELTRGVLVNGQLPATTKQMIAMAASTQNNCRYCTVTHTNVLEKMGVPAEVVRSCVEDPDFAAVPEPHRSILSFALKANRDPNSITDADYAQLNEKGLPREEIMEVVMMAAFTKFINTWADASGIAVDGAGA